MSRITNGEAGALRPVEVKCPNDELENFIRAYGVVAVCEWFGYPADSEFTKEAIAELESRSNA